MGALFIIGLLLSPIQQIDLRQGAAAIQDEGHLILTPGYHLQYGDLTLSLQTPLRMNLTESQLRSEDVDSIQDYGRTIRRISIGSLLDIGPLRNISDSNHITLNHFFNRINDDEPRTAMLIKTNLSGFKYAFFADELLGPPILGTLVELDAPSPFGMSTVVVIDTDARASEYSGEPHSFYGAGSFGVHYRLYRKGTVALTTGLTAAQTHLEGSGGHWGLTTNIGHAKGWRVENVVEAMGFSKGYSWAPFDLMYLVRKSNSSVYSDGAVQAGWGGRIRLKLSRKNLEFGLQSSAAWNSPQQVHLSWIRLNKKPFSLSALVYTGQHNRNSTVFTKANTYGAVSGQLNLSKRWMIETSIMHVQRRVNQGFQPYLEARLLSNWRLSFK